MLLRRQHDGPVPGIFAAKPLPRADLLRLVAGHLENRTTHDPDAPDSTGREPRADPQSA